MQCRRVLAGFGAHTEFAAKTRPSSHTGGKCLPGLKHRAAAEPARLTNRSQTHLPETASPAGTSHFLQPQRGCGSKLKVARARGQPWVVGRNCPQPRRGCGQRCRAGRNRVAVDNFLRPVSQGRLWHANLELEAGIPLGFFIRHVPETEDAPQPSHSSIHRWPSGILTKKD